MPCSTCTDEARCDRAGLCQNFHQPVLPRATGNARRECSYCAHRDTCPAARSGHDCGPGRPSWEPLTTGAPVDDGCPDPNCQACRPAGVAIPLVDHGPWSARKRTNDGKWCIQSEDFTHDVQLIVFGDFGDDADRKAYAERIAAQLNAHGVAGTLKENGNG